MTRALNRDTVYLESGHSSPAKMDETLNKICEQNGLIKSKLLESIGETIQTYANKRKRNGLNVEAVNALSLEMVKLSQTIAELANRVNSDEDHYALIESLYKRAYIKKSKIISMIGGHDHFLHDKFKRVRKLDSSEAIALRKGLLSIAAKLKSTSIF